MNLHKRSQTMKLLFFLVRPSPLITSNNKKMKEKNIKGTFYFKKKKIKEKDCFYLFCKVHIGNSYVSSLLVEFKLKQPLGIWRLGIECVSLCFWKKTDGTFTYLYTLENYWLYGCDGVVGESTNYINNLDFRLMHNMRPDIFIFFLF